MIESYGFWYGIVRWKAVVYGNHISSVGFDSSKVKINRRLVNLRAGVNKIPGGGQITLAGNKITLSTNDGEECDMYQFTSRNRGYFNAYVRSNVPTVSGLCSQQYVKSKLFRNPMKGKIEVVKQRHCHKKAHFANVCRRRGLNGQRLKNCVFDLCAGLSKRDEKKLIKIARRQKHIKLKRIIKRGRLPLIGRIGVVRRIRRIKVHRKHHRHHRHHRHHHHHGFLHRLIHRLHHHHHHNHFLHPTRFHVPIPIIRQIRRREEIRRIEHHEERRAEIRREEHHQEVRREIRREEHHAAAPAPRRR